jgi:hypothetical protein
MKLHISRAQKVFACKSLLWSLLLYGCFTGVSRWQAIQELFHKEQPPAAYSYTTTNIPSVIILPDSLHKSITIVGKVLYSISSYVSR